MKLFAHQQEALNKATQVVGFPGYYVTATGDVYSYRPGSLKRNNGKPLLLQQVVNFEGYLVITLYLNKKRSQGKVHRLVLSAHNPIENMDNSLVRHLDGDKTNNNLENLAWGDPFSNSQDMIRHGHSLKGIKNSAAKITPNIVVTIRHGVAGGYTQQSMTTQFGISKGHISNICARRVWKHV